MSKVIVIGGGPAGMMAAISAAQNGNEVTLIERMRSCGRKLSITGKGRGNVTNNADISEFINNVPGNGKFLYSAFNKFTNKDVIAFFNSRGVETKVERGERVFPVSDTAMSLVNALKKEMDAQGVTVKVDTKVNELIIGDNTIKGVRTDDGEIYADKVILASGGKSYSTTGSDGFGYKLAEQAGHTIVEPRGSLVPLEIYETYDLQGLSLKNVSIKVIDGLKEVYEDFGEMLFTHFGVSGPIILSASSHIIRIKNLEGKLKNKNIKILLDLKPALEFETLDKRIQRDFEKYANKHFKNALDDLLPSKMIPEIIRLSGIDEEKEVNQITREERLNLIKTLKEFEMTVKKFRPVEEAIVTAGGVSTKEINPQTMESKICKGLFFAGEVIDVDAYTGGFNLQIAFSTGHLAGQNV